MDFHFSHASLMSIINVETLEHRRLRAQTYISYLSFWLEILSTIIGYLDFSNRLSFFALTRIVLITYFIPAIVTIIHCCNRTIQNYIRVINELEIYLFVQPTNISYSKFFFY